MGNSNAISNNATVNPPVNTELILSKNNWRDRIKEETQNVRAKYLGWTQLPLEICDKLQLTKLDISSNCLVSLPNEITNLENLTSLYLPNNRLKSIPNVLGELPNLRILCLRSNEITKIDDVDGFFQLTELDLSFNRLSSFPTSLRKLPELKSLSFQIITHNMDENVFDGFENLEFLSMTTYKQQIPASLFNLKNLEVLEIWASNIPREMENLEKLKSLKIFTLQTYNQKDLRFYPLACIIKLSDLSSADNFLPEDFDSLLFYKLGIVIYPPELDLSEYTIPEGLNIIINDSFEITKERGNILKITSECQTYLPNIGDVQEIHKDNYSRVDVVDSCGNIWTIDNSMYNIIKKYYPTKIKTPPNPKNGLISCIDENNNVECSSIGFNSWSNKTIRDEKGEHIDHIQGVYYVYHSTIVLLTSGSVWYYSSTGKWELFDIPPIWKIVAVPDFFLLIDENNILWNYGRKSQDCTFNSLCTHDLRLIKLSEIVSDIPLVKDVFLGYRSLFLQDLEGCIWALGDNDSGQINPGHTKRYYDKFTKIEYPMEILKIYPLGDFTIFIDIEFNIWTSGKSEILVSKDKPPSDLILIDNVKKYLPGFSKQKSARF